MRPDLAELPAELTCPAGLRALAGHLRGAGFDADRAAGLLGAPSPEHLLGDPARYAFFAGPVPPGPVAVLTWLFILNARVPADLVRGGLDRELIELLRDLGLLATAGDGYRGTVSITPYRSRFFVSDQLFTCTGPQQVRANTGPGLVMPPHASSLLALATVDRIDDTLLDVGCGGGFLAVNAAARCGTVAGIDPNPRCARLAGWNGVLNGVEAGFAVADIASFTVPGDDRFGALIFNTPTLPRIRSTEDSEWGQSTADRLVRQTLDAAPRILRPGGTAYVQALVEVPRRYSSAAAAVRDWAGGHDVTVTPIDAPQLSVTREQLRRRRLPGHSLLAYGARSGELLDALAARDVVAVEPVTIAARVRP